MQNGGNTVTEAQDPSLYTFAWRFYWSVTITPMPSSLPNKPHVPLLLDGANKWNDVAVIQCLNLIHIFINFIRYESGMKRLSGVIKKAIYYYICVQF